MNPIVKKYKVISEDSDLVYTDHLAYQRDMSKSVSYDEQYYQNYVGREGTDIAKKLNQARVGLTEKYCKSSLLDVGIGSGEFIKSSRLKVYGFDINPCGVDWLQERGLFLDPYQSPPAHVEGFTLWDTLEHIPDPAKLFDSVLVGKYAFVSLPTFEEVLKVKESKHYKPNEHYYYFTVPGLIKYMRDYGFVYLEHNDHETKAGREGITAFVFRKELEFSAEWLKVKPLLPPQGMRCEVR